MGNRARGEGSFDAAFGKLRDEICLRASGAPPQVIMVASARRGEGRSAVAAGLARAFGRAASTPALLVDFDLRRPSLHGLFGASAAPGVSDLLRQEADLEASLQLVGDGTVNLLPAGSRSSDATMLMAAPTLEALLSMLRSRGDALIIDPPPMEGGVESELMARAADAVVLVVHADSTVERDARAASAGLFALEGANLVGVVLNGARRGVPSLALGVVPPSRVTERV